MRYLATGGAGFIGSNIVETLLKDETKGLSPKAKLEVIQGTVPASKERI